MELIIKSITEAYSMQPVTLEISTATDHEMQKQKSCSATLYKWRKNYIKKIQLTDSKYVGYNFLDEVLFEYLSDSVNIHYLIEQ